LTPVRRATLFALLCVLLAGCFPKTPPPSAVVSTILPAKPASNDFIRVKAWADNPTPKSGERVIVYGSLIKRTVWLGGIMMQASWADPSHIPGTPNCFVLVTYGRGVCVIETAGFTPGVYVPVQIKFVYRGETYTGSTGFTPH
jgi:hypothetical protein